VLVITPPLLERLVGDDELVALVNRTVTAFYTAGASMDRDTRHLLRTEVFPDVLLHGSYGGTMALCPTASRCGTAGEDLVVCDPYSRTSRFPWSTSSPASRCLTASAGR
jgi:hypothetical protein